MRRVRVVIGVSPRPLLRAVEHLLCTQESIRIVSRCSYKNHLLAHSCLQSPELIVVNARLLGRRLCESIAEIRRRSPQSRLILVCPIKEFSSAVGNCGADGGIDEEALVRDLPRLVRKVLRNRIVDPVSRS